MASEFDYSLPRQRKGYDTVDYKQKRDDRNAQSDPRIVANVRPYGDNDKGYYSDRTYESPLSGRTHPEESGDIGYRTVARGRKDFVDELCHST